MGAPCEPGNFAEHSGPCVPARDMSEGLGMCTDIEKQDELLSVLENAFFAIVRVNPEEDSCWFLQRVGKRHCEKRYPYSRLLRAIGKFVYAKYRSSVLYALNPSNLKKRDFAPDFTLDFAYASFNEEKWVSASFVCDPKSRNVYLLLKKCREYDVVLRDIVNLYVYDRCDYFIYLDAQTNSYVMFSGSDNGTPLPPQICNDYDTEIVKYADLYVAPEDRDMVIFEMKLGRVVEMLERNGSHSFYTGVIDPVRGYTRKKLEYQYYNRERKKILLWRTDISQLYHDEIERNARLREALIKAQTDSMTGLLNKQAFEDEVSASLEKNMSLAAFLFVDLDNFKAVNDRFGHNTGDRVLLAFASILKRTTVDKQAIVGRIGGDEFAVFLGRIDVREEACQLASSICEVFAAEAGQICPLATCSIGIAFCPEDATCFKDLVERADLRTYAVKASGKNGFSST